MTGVLPPCGPTSHGRGSSARLVAAATWLQIGTPVWCHVQGGMTCDQGLDSLWAREPWKRIECETSCGCHVARVAGVLIPCGPRSMEEDPVRDLLRLRRGFKLELQFGAMSRVA